ncbi:Uncharacterised protein [Nocardia africana]|uniref:Uncharacterized protein n=1 Tax=Nocardia africana TaxID=134964 RepID=A0A378WWE8_9NOCA|nr:Uncharacterised protein [Nocardia africana]
MVENEIEIVNTGAGHDLTITEQLLYYLVVWATYGRGAARRRGRR